MEEVPCILCGRRGEPRFAKADKFPPHERFGVVRCPACGLRWVSPRPEPEALARYYPDTYSWKPPAEAETESAVRRAERWYRFHLLRFEVRQLVRGASLSPGQAVLDIGCSSGDRLLAMQEAGLVPAGVELGPAADYARDRLGLDVRRARLPEAGFGPGRFHAVTLYNVLEHLPDPRAVLAEARRLLVPGGRLVVQVPNGRSLQARLFGRRWAAVDVPRDLWYWTPALLGRLLEAEGFRVTRVLHRTSLLHPPTAAVSLVPWADPQRFWAAEAGGGRLGGLARRLVWAAVTVAAMGPVWVESARGASAIPTLFARKE